MTDTPTLFRQSIENLFGKGNLSPFLEATTNAFSAVFEAANSISRKQAATALSKLPAYRGTPYEEIGGWEGTDLATMRDAYNTRIAKKNPSLMVKEVEEDEPEPRAQPQPKAASQPAQNTQAQNPANRQNTSTTPQPNPSTQQPQPAPQPQPKATVQPATPSNVNSAQHSTQNQNKAPAPPPSTSNAQNQQQQKEKESKGSNLYRAFRNTVCQTVNTALTGDKQKNYAEREKCNEKWK